MKESTVVAILGVAFFVVLAVLAISGSIQQSNEQKAKSDVIKACLDSRGMPRIVDDALQECKRDVRQ